MSKGLFRGAIMWSACNFSGDNGPLATAENTGVEIQKALKAANLDEMRQVPADRILGIQGENQLGLSITGFRTGGMMDGYFSTKKKADLLAAHEANDIPIIASFTHDEGASPLKQAKTVAEYKAAAVKAYGDAADEFLKLYPVTKDEEIVPVAQAAANDAGGMTGACNCATLQAKYNKSATYIMVFARKHPYVPGVKIADQDTATVGAYHTSEVPYFFGTQDAFNLFRPTRAWTPWDRELSEKMTAVLVAFANTGVPATNDVKWPAWSAQNQQYIQFGDKISVEKVNLPGLEFASKHRAAAAAPAPRPTGFPRD
jgi:para-nitrobenzyl esterase